MEKAILLHLEIRKLHRREIKIVETHVGGTFFACMQIHKHFRRSFFFDFYKKKVSCENVLNFMIASHVWQAFDGVVEHVGSSVDKISLLA